MMKERTAQLYFFVYAAEFNRPMKLKTEFA